MPTRSPEEEERASGPRATPKHRGRPVIREIKLDATPEQVARAMFAPVKPPDPSKRIHQSK